MWEDRFSELVAYKDRFGDCNVPQNSMENHKLAKWVSRQRKSWNANKLPEERIRRLDELGVVWDPLQSLWDERFKELAAYKDRFGNCNVPDKWNENPELAQWVSSHRNLRKASKVSEDRIRRLDELAFVWDTLDAAWEDKFRELVDYKKTVGDCNVPTRWQQNIKLSGWVSRQRTFRKAKKLSADRIRRLDGLGFAWDRLKTVS